MSGHANLVRRFQGKLACDLANNVYSAATVFGCDAKQALKARCGAVIAMDRYLAETESLAKRGAERISKIEAGC